MNPPAVKIAIIGPGSIGLLIASILSRSGHNLFLVDYNPQRAARRNSDGIFIVEKGNRQHIALNSSANASDFGKADFIFICTKAYDTVTAVKHLPQLADDDTIIISLQNGIGNAEKISKAIQTDHILCASTSMAAYIENRDTIHRIGGGLTQLAPFGNTPASDATKVAKLLNDVGCETNCVDDAQSMLWSKLIINAAINPVTALFRITNGELLNQAEALSMAYKAAAEAQKVADTLGIKLTYQSVFAAIDETCRKTANNRSSMLQDIENKRQTEIESITGAIIAEAERLKIQVPTNKGLFQSIVRATRMSHKKSINK